MSTTFTRLVVTRSGELTKASARDLRAMLRRLGVTHVEQYTAHTPIEVALNALGAAGVDMSTFEVVGYGDLTPAQRGGITRKRNARAAKKAARKESTGYVREQIRARKALSA